MPRKKSIIHQAEQFVASASIIESLARNLNTYASCDALLRFLKLCNKRAMKLRASIIIKEGLTTPGKKKRKHPGEGEDWNRFKSPHRCWACYLIGTECINPFLNRRACSRFRFNNVLLDHMDRVKDMQMDNSSTLGKLKLPKIKTFSEHIVSCKHCDKLSNKKNREKGVIQEKRSLHYQKYRASRLIKVAVKFAFYGIVYKEDYVLGWRD